MSILSRFLRLGRPNRDDPVAIQPWMPVAATKRLQLHLQGAKVYLEYGAGGSTLLSGKLNCPIVYSVESDRGFLDTLSHQMHEAHSDTTFHPTYINIGPTRKLGYPTDPTFRPLWPNYCTAVWKDLNVRSLCPDLVLIDGRFRVACFAYSLAHASSGTILLFDDYERRNRYHIAGSLLKPAGIYGGLAEFVVPPDVDKHACRQMFDKFKHRPGM